MKLYILIQNYDFYHCGERHIKINEIVHIFPTLKSAQKAMAEVLHMHMDNHPWNGVTCNATKPFDSYDFHEMNNMFEDDPEFTFDATNTELMNSNEFVRLTIEEREMIDNRLPKWDFNYEEEIWDHAGTNMAGILTNGNKTLFWHALADNEGEPVKCHIYDSIWMDEANELFVYEWSAENDSKLLELLNNAKTADYKTVFKNAVLSEDETLVIVWPYVQNLFEQKGFRDNSALCCSDEAYSQYGDSTYIVRKIWYNKLSETILSKTNEGIVSNCGPLFSKAIKDENIYTI